MVDINCDMGEGMGNDEALMLYISSASIACGYHAGDSDTMRHAIALCRQYNVAVGAHPSFNDKANFGRKEMYLSDAVLQALVTKQLQLFAAIANEAGMRVHHVKPHGALYNMAASSAVMSSVIAKAIFGFDKQLVLYGLAGSPLISAGKKAGLNTMSEAFADRTYQPDGSLTPRSHTNALIHDPSQAVKQVLKMVNDKKVTAVDGTEISINAETICIHGDGENALAIAKAVYMALKKYTTN